MLAITYNSLPQHRRGTRIAGNGSYKLPGAPYTVQDPGKKAKNLYFKSRFFIYTIQKNPYIPCIFLLKGSIRGDIFFTVYRRNVPAIFRNIWTGIPYRLAAVIPYVLLFCQIFGQCFWPGFGQVWGRFWEGFWQVFDRFLKGKTKKTTKTVNLKKNTFFY